MSEILVSSPDMLVIEAEGEKIVLRNIDGEWKVTKEYAAKEELQGQEMPRMQ